MRTFTCSSTFLYGLNWHFDKYNYTKMEIDKIDRNSAWYFRKQLRLLKEAGLVQIIISKNNRWAIL